VLCSATARSSRCVAAAAVLAILAVVITAAVLAVVFTAAVLAVVVHVLCVSERAVHTVHIYLTAVSHVCSTTLVRAASWLLLATNTDVSTALLMLFTTPLNSSTLTAALV
jgi:hypothetical protein